MDNLIQQVGEMRIQRPPFGGRWHSFEVTPNNFLIAHRFTDTSIQSPKILGRANESQDNWHAVGPLAKSLISIEEQDLTKLFSMFRSSSAIGTFYPNEVLVSRDNIIVGYDEVLDRPFPYDAVRAACFSSGRQALTSIKNSGASKKQVNEFENNFDRVAYEVLLDIYEDLKKGKDVGAFLKSVFSQIKNESIKQEFLSKDIINANGWKEFLEQ